MEQVRNKNGKSGNTCDGILSVYVTIRFKGRNVNVVVDKGEGWKGGGGRVETEIERQRD